jgi:predicted nucleotidyltransferase
MGRAPQLDEVIALLKQHESFFREKGVTRLAVFGSVARGDATEESDIDLVIEVDDTAKFGLFDHVEVEQDSADVLKRKVDVVLRQGLKPRFAAMVDRDAVDVFRS